MYTMWTCPVQHDLITVFEVNAFALCSDFIGEPERTQNDQQCIKAWMPLRPSWDEMEGKGAQRTLAASGLVGEPWQKHVRNLTPNS